LGSKEKEPSNGHYSQKYKTLFVVIDREGGGRSDGIGIRSITIMKARVRMVLRGDWEERQQCGSVQRNWVTVLEICY